MLHEYFTDNPAMQHVKALSGMWKDAGAKMLREDLGKTEIEEVPEDGVIDFHSLRHTFGTLLAKSGVMPQDAQKLIRHSDINLTMGVYDHLRLSDKAKAVCKLPEIEINKQQLAKTGTNDMPENLTSNLTQNSNKPCKNTARSSKPVDASDTGVNAITPSKTNNLQRVTASRPGGLEPPTYG